MSSPYTFEDSLRAHDVAFDAWLGTLRVDYPPDKNGLWTQRLNQPVLRVRATPDRAVASLVETMVSRGWFVNEADAASMRQKAQQMWTLPLPVCTWQRGDPQPDPQLAGPPKTARREYDPVTGKFIAHPWPGHYQTEYTVTFWALKQWTDDFLREWVYGQLGNIGADHNQVFIPVAHKDPWGTLLQSLVMTGSTDESEYEGAEPRYKRVTFTFQLRTWVFKVTTAETYPITTFVPELAFADVAGADLAYPQSTAQSVQSDNLFGFFMTDSLVPTKWPKTGGAQVQKGFINCGTPREWAADSLSFKLTTSDDSVELLEFPTGLNDDGEAIFSVYGDYRSTGPFGLEAAQRNTPAATRTVCHYVNAPKASAWWGRFHRFLYFTELLGTVSVVGTGLQALGTLHGINIRRIAPVGKLAPASVTGTGAVFTLLPPEPFLVVAKITSGPDGLYTVDDDQTTPANSVVQYADPAFTAGVVLLAQPKTDSLRITWPAGTTIASVWVQRYNSTYYGNSF